MPTHLQEELARGIAEVLSAERNRYIDLCLTACRWQAEHGGSAADCVRMLEEFRAGVNEASPPPTKRN
jgi:hypothetical protein